VTIIVHTQIFDGGTTSRNFISTQNQSIFVEPSSKQVNCFQPNFLQYAEKSLLEVVTCKEISHLSVHPHKTLSEEQSSITNVETELKKKIVTIKSAGSN
jgi:hypothetical protein